MKELLKPLSTTVFIFIFIALNTFSQIDFNDFKNLQAEGQIPEDFTVSGFNKIKLDIQSEKVKLKKNSEKVFLEGVHYAINDLLHSGMVVYGDPVTKYIEEVADKLLVKDQKLRNELRFYLIKSNETNAFSTFQGIIFVTTGLISQLTNEAQLAYVLSHEIAHYTEEHVVSGYDFYQKNRNNRDKIQSLSKFSKENEFNADKIGVNLYNQAGYSKDHLVSTFDVLLYSYLPFEEVEFPKNHFNTNLITIPEGFFPPQKYEIKANEGADDSKSSHPNVKSRKIAAIAESENFKEWGKEAFLLGEKRFKEIRTLCRFESIRSDIIDAEFDDALYSIFILEKEFPNSIYLDRMKAKAWLGISQYRISGGLSKKLPLRSEYEGSIANLQFLIKELNRNQILTLSLRQIEDIRKKRSEDPIIGAIWDKMVNLVANYDKFDLSKYSSISYEDAVKKFNQDKKDTISKTSEDKENLSKYEKIKLENKSVTVVSFDTSSFYLYGLSDLINLPSFTAKFSEFREQKDLKEKNRNDFNKLSYREQKKVNKQYDKEHKLSINSMIYLEPLVFSYGKNGLNRIKSEELQINYSNSVLNLSQEFGMQVTLLSSTNLGEGGTEAFNQNATLKSFFSEVTENSEIEVFPTDFNLLLELKEKTGTDKVMLSFLEHEKRMQFNPNLIYLGALFYPIIFITVPATIMKQNHISFTSIILDLTKGEIIAKQSIDNSEPINKFTIDARVYQLLKSIQ